MPRITPVNWKILECIFTKYGFVFSRHNGTSHRVYEKAGCLRPVIIPTYNEIDNDIISSNMRTAGMTRREYFELLNQCR